jgi:hypothetical protein
MFRGININIVNSIRALSLNVYRLIPSLLLIYQLLTKTFIMHAILLSLGNKEMNLEQQLLKLKSQKLKRVVGTQLAKIRQEINEITDSIKNEIEEL